MSKEKYPKSELPHKNNVELLMEIRSWAERLKEVNDPPEAKNIIEELEFLGRGLIIEPKPDRKTVLLGIKNTAQKIRDARSPEDAATKVAELSELVKQL